MTIQVPYAGRALGVAIGSVLLILAGLPPFVGEEVRQALMLVFSSLCHQIPERSPHVDGIQLAVCHRCFGIYFALAVGAAAYGFLQRWDDPINRHARLFVLGAVLIPGVDWLGDVVGLWINTAVSRAATGAVFGLVLGYFLSRAFDYLFTSDTASEKTGIE